MLATQQARNLSPGSAVWLRLLLRLGWPIFLPSFQVHLSHSQGPESLDDLGDQGAGHVGMCEQRHSR